MNKQITIEQLLPLLRRGFVTMDKDGDWAWHSDKPEYNVGYCCWGSEDGLYIPLTGLFNIKKFDGDWKDSLMEVK